MTPTQQRDQRHPGLRTPRVLGHTLLLGTPAHTQVRCLTHWAATGFWPAPATASEMTAGKSLSPWSARTKTRTGGRRAGGVLAYRLRITGIRKPRSEKRDRRCSSDPSRVRSYSRIPSASRCKNVGTPTGRYSKSLVTPRLSDAHRPPDMSEGHWCSQRLMAQTRAPSTPSVKNLSPKQGNE